MLSSSELASLITLALAAHADQSKKQSGAYRKWDGETPYGVHPIVCATLLLQETALPLGLRVSGARALLFHDVPEDTNAKLPDALSETERRLVEDMTFVSSDVEMEQVWSRPVWIWLYKLYDKVSNLLDGVWMTPEKRAKYCAYVLRLADAVEKEYGLLNIVKIARAVAS